MASARVIDAAGPGVAVILHGMYERGGPAVVDSFPGGAGGAPGWRRSMSHRHLATHEGHLVELTDRDPQASRAVCPSPTGSFTLTARRAEIGPRIEALAAQGITELAYQPCGPDLPRELEAFAAAAGAGGRRR